MGIKDEASAPGAMERALGTFIEEVDGTVLELRVEGFDAARTMDSYLRLGAAAAGAGDATDPGKDGEDLASLVTGFSDDIRVRSDGVHSARPQTLIKGVLDKGLIEGSPVDSEGRKAESSNLHKKGGWRDHSDGNRITTTRGDKVEVIRGNYQLLVLGRQSTHGIQQKDELERLRARNV